jgi:hypothetical protein
MMSGRLEGLFVMRWPEIALAAHVVVLSAMFGPALICTLF